MSIIFDIQPQTFFDDCLIDLESQRKDLTPTEYTSAKNTINGIKIIYEEKESLSSTEDENERNQKITDLTKLITDKGLISGSTPEEIEASLFTVVNELMSAYLFDKDKNETFLFFRMAFMSPPCFNSRIKTLQDYVLARQKIKLPLYFETSCSYDKFAIQLEELMYKYDEDKKKKSTLPPSLEKLLLFIKQNPNHSKIMLPKNNLEKIYERACEFYNEMI